MTHQTPAMILVLSHRLYPDVQTCIEYCLAMGYHMCGVIKDDWKIAVEYLYKGEADVIVVADGRTLHPDRTPRVEVVAHQRSQPDRPDIPAGHRGSDDRPEGSPPAHGERTHMIKRSEEE